MVTGASKIRRRDLSTPMLRDRAYWVVTGKFMAGAYPGSKDAGERLMRLKRLVDCGIQHVINLMEPDEVGHSCEPFVRYLSSIRTGLNSWEISGNH